MPNVRIVCKARCGRCATRRSACTLNRCCRVARRGSTEKRAPRVVRCMRIGRRVRSSTCPTNRRARMPMQPHGGDRVRGQTNMHDRALQIRNVSRVSIRAIRMPLAAAEIPCRARRSRAESRAAHCADESGRSTRFKPTQADSTPVRKPSAAVSQAAFARRRRCRRPVRRTTRARARRASVSRVPVDTASVAVVKRSASPRMAAARAGSGRSAAGLNIAGADAARVPVRRRTAAHRVDARPHREERLMT